MQCVDDGLTTLKVANDRTSKLRSSRKNAKPAAKLLSKCTTLCYCFENTHKVVGVREEGGGRDFYTSKT